MIGGWRDRYRSLGEGDQPPWKLNGRGIWQYRLGPDIDPSGQLADGRSFADIDEYKQLLLDQREQILRAVTEKLIVYATGARVRFCDRPEVERIVAKVSAKGGGLRSLIHEVVQSPLFLNK